MPMMAVPPSSYSTMNLMSLSWSRAMECPPWSERPAYRQSAQFPVWLGSRQVQDDASDDSRLRIAPCRIQMDFASFRRSLHHVRRTPNSDRRADIDLCRRRDQKATLALPRPCRAEVA